MLPFDELVWSFFGCKGRRRLKYFLPIAMGFGSGRYIVSYRMLKGGAYLKMGIEQSVIFWSFRYKTSPVRVRNVLDLRWNKIFLSNFQCNGVTGFCENLNILFCQLRITSEFSLLTLKTRVDA